MNSHAQQYFQDLSIAKTNLLHSQHTEMNSWVVIGAIENFHLQKEKKTIENHIGAVILCMVFRSSLLVTLT